MGAMNVRCLALVAFVIAGVRVSAQSCQGDFKGLMMQCINYVQKEGPATPPSQECCNMIKKTDIPCFCKLVTKEVEQQISMEKVVYIARYCGKTVPSGMKCGSYTVPVA